jgi:class 3 adenylate cyclase
MSTAAAATADDLPTGTVTFLFTDIEGSTRLLETRPEAMHPALARHDALARGAIEGHGGRVFKTIGDAFCAAFATAPDAVAAALALQRALLRAADPPMPFRVRIALHSGAAEARDNDYFGASLSRAARLRDAAHGGQTLLTLATVELARDALPNGADLKDLGAHRLRDVQRPEHVFQLVHPDLPPDDFPPLRTLDNLPNNLPRQLTSFIGREKELADVRRLLETACLLTLTGAGGAGKTRLALQAGADAWTRSRTACGWWSWPRSAARRWCRKPWPAR